MNLADFLPEPLRTSYQFEGVLGRGAMGVVLSARDRTTGEAVAIKLVARDADSLSLDRLRREARLLERLDHPHVVRVLAHGESPQGPWLMMERVPGRDLSSDPPDDPLPVLLEVGAALDAVHAAGVLHRDVKPANILLAPGRGAVLVDFGLAWRPEMTRITATGAVPGTLAALAPERIRGEPASAATDWYALGVTGFTLCEGRLPYETKDLSAVMAGRPLPPPEFRSLDPDSPRARMLRALLAPDPEDRPASVAQLKRILDGGPLPSAQRVPARPLPASPALQTSPGSSRRGPLAAALAAATLLLGLRLGGPPEVPPEGPSPPSPPAAVPGRAPRLLAPPPPPPLLEVAASRDPVARPTTSPTTISPGTPRFAPLLLVQAETAAAPPPGAAPEAAPEEAGYAPAEPNPGVQAGPDPAAGSRPTVADAVPDPPACPPSRPGDPQRAFARARCLRQAGAPDGPGSEARELLVDGALLGHEASILELSDLLLAEGGEATREAANWLERAAREGSEVAARRLASLGR